MVLQLHLINTSFKQNYVFREFESFVVLPRNEYKDNCNIMYQGRRKKTEVLLRSSGSYTSGLPRLYCLFGFFFDKFEHDFQINIGFIFIRLLLTPKCSREINSYHILMMKKKLENHIQYLLVP